MNSKSLPLLAVVWVLMGLVLSGCSRHTEQKDNNVAYYTCTMHPSVRMQNPKDKCPICGMSLVPVLKKDATTNAPATNAAAAGHDHAQMQETPTAFTVAVQRQQQIGVTYATIGRNRLRRTIRSVGTVAQDKQRQWDFVARVEGYVQKLHVSSRGELVEKGQPLVTIFSPELLTTQREYLDVLRMREEAQKSGSQPALESANKLIESANRRLALWNIAPEQIAELERTRTAKDTLTLYSPFKGVVQSLPAGQGGRVAAGDRLVEVADLSVLWVWAQFYQDDLPLLKPDRLVTLTTDSSAEKLTGKIALVDPFINDISRTVRVRIDLENPDLRLRPGMFLNVFLEDDAGDGLSVPVSAVLPTGELSLVFVDHGEGKLEPRFIELGKKYGTDYALVNGLREGERIVSSGNFLIDAEARVQGALKSW